MRSATRLAMLVALILITRRAFITPSGELLVAQVILLVSFVAVTYLDSGGKRAGQLPSRRLWKISEAVAMTISAASFCYAWGLHMHFAFSRPTSPNSLEGRVYPLNTHGDWVYLNAQEHFLLTSLYVVFVALALLAIAIDWLKNPYQVTRD
jgi:hypothetical protein